MTPGNYPLALYRGDSYHWQFILWADVDKTIPADLTDVEALAEIRDKPSGLKVVPIDCVITLPNIIDAGLTADNCKLVPPGSSTAWDLQLTYSSGDVSTILAGKVSMVLDISDSTPPTAPPVIP